jgi:hypothetical protein
LAPSIDTYRVGEAEFGIDFGTLDRSQVPPPRTPARGAPVGLVPSQTPNPAQGVPTGRGLPVASAIDTTVIAEAQRARYVRDTLSRFSAGLEKGRDASAHETAASGPDGPGAQAPAPPPS